MILDGLSKWEKTIQTVVNTSFTVEQQVSFKLDYDEALAFLMELPTKMEAWLREFVVRQMLNRQEGVIGQYFNKMAKDKDYWPTFVRKDGPEVYRVGTGKRAKVNMEQGFDTLWNVFSNEPEVSRQGSRIEVGVGRRSQVEALRLNAYMGTSGSMFTHSRLNSLFKAVEFGTGIAQNVGAAWVNLEGDTKDKDVPGAWWFGSRSNRTYDEDNRGVLMLGQKAMHFLYDERREKPRQEYLDFFHRHFPRFVAKKLSGTGVRVRGSSSV